jgi:hypothetical protein
MLDGTVVRDRKSGTTRKIREPLPISRRRTNSDTASGDGLVEPLRLFSALSSGFSLRMYWMIPSLAFSCRNILILR